MGIVEKHPNSPAFTPVLSKSFEWLTEQPNQPLFKHIRELKRRETTKERAYRVAGARAVLVNYALIQHDFSFLRNEALMRRFPDLNGMTAQARKAEIERIIDNWLVENTAYISGAQIDQDHVSTPITLGEEVTFAYRPPDYGRALVFSLVENAKSMGLEPLQGGLLDVKGVGVEPGETPTFEDHSNGLLDLGTALLEVLQQQIMERVFRHAGGEFDTLPNYGVIDLGFSIKWPEGPQTPAGLLVRRAHVRQWDAGGFPSSKREEVYIMEVENILRKYGITSTCYGTTYTIWEANGKAYYINNLQRNLIELTPEALKTLRKWFDISTKPITVQSANVQLTRDLNKTNPKTTLVDFTHYNISEEFTHAIYTPDNKQVVYLGNMISRPGDPSFVQPDPKCRIPYDVSGVRGSIWGLQPKGVDRKIRSLCFNMAAGFSAGMLSKQDVSAYLGTYLELVSGHLTG